MKLIVITLQSWTDCIRFRAAQAETITYQLFKHIHHFYIENNTWVRGNTRFISSVERDISRVSAANEYF